jgi:hypothetical protein
MWDVVHDGKRILLTSIMHSYDMISVPPTVLSPYPVLSCPALSIERMMQAGLPMVVIDQRSLKRIMKQLTYRQTIMYDLIVST